MSRHPALPALADTYEDHDVDDGLIVRICPTLPCDNPVCSCRTDPGVLLAYSEADGDRWVAGRFMAEAEVEELIEGFSESALDNMRASSILFGAPWRFFEDADVLDTLVAHQRQAYADVPHWYFEQPLEQLRSVRAAINEVDPLPVYQLLKMAYFVGREVGGSRGRTP